MPRPVVASLICARFVNPAKGNLLWFKPGYLAGKHPVSLTKPKNFHKLLYYN